MQVYPFGFSPLAGFSISSSIRAESAAVIAQIYKVTLCGLTLRNSPAECLIYRFAVKSSRRTIFNKNLTIGQI
jgi:hypothetical protein